MKKTRGSLQLLTWVCSFFSTASMYAGDLSVPAGLLVRSGLSSTFVAKFALFAALFLGWIIVSGKVLNYLLRLPIIAGQIIGGVLLGPSLINIAGIPFFAEPLSVVEYTNGFVYSLVSSDLFVFFILLLSSAFTVSYLLWLAGYETDVHDILSIGVTPVAAGFFGAVLPIGMTAGFLYYFFGHEWSLVQALSVGVIFAATSVSIPIAMLFASNKMHLKSSKATLGAAIVDDILAVILLSLFFLCVQSGMFGPVVCHLDGCHFSSLTEALGYMAVGFALLCVGGYVAVPRLITFLQDKQLYSLVAPVATIIMLGSFAFSELFAGLAGITGAYFAGVFHRLGDVRHRAEKAVAPFVNAVLLPLFLGSIGLQVDVSVLNTYDWVLVVLLLLVAILSKMIGCWLATSMSNGSGRKGAGRWSAIETYLFGSSMVARGEVGLVISTILYGAGFIEPHQYVISVVVIVLTTIAASVMLSLGFSYTDGQGKLLQDEAESAVVLGPFPAVGTMQMFNVIIGQLKILGLYKTFIPMSEGRKVINIEEHGVRIILRPGRDITFKGNPEKVQEILNLVKNAILHDVERLSP